jgi:nucleotide-binding universal stress UspA family protein
MYPKILVPLDGTEASVAGLNEAIAMVKQQQGGTLRLLHVVVLPDPILDYGYGTHTCRKDMVASMCAIGKRLLGNAESLVRAQGLRPECVMFESGSRSAADVILDQARQSGASLIVMGSHARHEGLRVGRVTAEVLAESEIPVLLVRASQVKTEKPEVEPCAVDVR